MKNIAPFALISAPLVWFGLILGISFLEAPLKFQAPNITLALGLGIGRLVFNTLNKLEWIMLIFSCIGFLSIRKHKNILITLIIILFLMLLYQTFYLLPGLDARALSIISGETVAKSSLHLIYVVLEILKAVLLIVFSIFSFKSIQFEKRY